GFSRDWSSDVCSSDLRGVCSGFVSRLPRRSDRMGPGAERPAPFRVREHVVRSMCQKRVPKPTLKLQKSWSGGLLVSPLDGVLGGQVWLVYTTSDQGFCTPWTYTRGVCYKQTVSPLEPITV